MRRSILLLAITGTYAVTSSAQTRPEPFNTKHIALDIAIDYSAKRLAGTATLELENWTSRPTREVSLLIGRLMEASAVREGAGGSLAYTQVVVRLSDLPMRQVTQLRVKLARPVPAGGRTTIRVDYAGNLVGYTEVGWLYVRDRIDTAFTILREEALAFPTVGGISFAANRQAPRSGFTYDASIRVPAGYVVATGGVITRTAHNDGSETWRYVTDTPSGVLNICVAPFDTIVESGVRLFHLKADSVGARRVMLSTQSALRLLTDWFGPQRGAINLTITEIPDGWGSQADLIAGIIQSAAAFQDPGRLGELYHELAHLWNVRDLDNPSPRWNEGYASFIEDLLRERIDGWSGRDEAEARAIAAVKRMLAADSLLRATPFVDYGRREMTGRSYWVGHLMFAALHEIVGDSDFNRIIGGYYRGFANGGTTRQFVDFATKISQRDLSRFFDDWLFTTRWTELLQNASSIAELAAHYRA